MSVWSKLAMNVGGEFSWNSNIDLTEFNSDLDHLYELGMRHVRIALPLWDGEVIYAPTTLEKWHNMCASAKSKGFYVIWGLTTQFSYINSSNWADIKNIFYEEAVEANNSLHVDEFNLGNELELKHDGSISDQTIQQDISNLATSLKSINGFTMKLSYPIAQNNWGYWDDVGVQGLGGLDYVGLNIYGYQNNFENFRTEVTKLRNIFGVKSKIYEWNIDPSWNGNWTTDAYQLRSKLSLRKDFLKSCGLSHEHYFFTWRYNNDQFSQKKSDGSFSPLYHELFSARSIA